MKLKQQLNGTINKLESLQNQHTSKQQLMIVLEPWLTLYHKIAVNAHDMSASDCLSELVGQLVHMFLGNPANPDPGEEILQLLYRVLLDIDRTQIKAAGDHKSIVQLIIDHLLTGSGGHSEKVNIQLAELIFSLCTSPTGEVAVSIRQHELLYGIIAMIEQFFQPFSKQKSVDCQIEFSDQNQDAKMGSLSLLMWAAACILWRNTDEMNSGLYGETQKLCKEIAPKILEPLARLSLLEGQEFEHILHSSVTDHVMKSSRWLLCSFIRAVPDNLDNLLNYYGISEEPIPKNLKVLTAIGCICQSKPAIEKLQNNFQLEFWIQKVIQICEYDEKTQFDLTQLLAIVECLQSLSIISNVCQLLEQSDDGPAFFRRLMNFLIDKHLHICAIANLKLYTRLNVAFINLVRRCLTYGGLHRSRIAKYLCSLLSTITAQMDNMASGKLNESPLLQMLHRFVLDDEIVKVHFSNVVQLGARRREALVPLHESNARMAHPIFGCNSGDVILDLSVYTHCSDLIPHGLKEARATPTGKSSKGKSTANSTNSATDHWMKSYGFVPTVSTVNEEGNSSGSQQPADSSTSTEMVKSHVFVPPPSAAIANEESSGSKQPADWSMSMEMDDLEWNSADWNPTASSTQLPMPKFAKKPLYPRDPRLEKIIGGFNSIKDERDIQLFDANKNSQLNAEQTLNQLLQKQMAAEENDGYMVLCLSMRYANKDIKVSNPRMKGKRQSSASTVKSTGLSTENKVSLSTLEQFSKTGGLIELSKHMYLYQLSLTRLLQCCENLSADVVARQQSVQIQSSVAGSSSAAIPPINTNITFDDFEFIDDFPAAIPMFSTFGLQSNSMGQPGTGSDQIPVPTSSMVVSIPVELAGGEPTPVHPSQWQWGPWNMGTTNVGAASQHNSVSGKRIRANAVNLPADHSRYNSAHVITVLGLFLRLEKYAEIMIQMDRIKAKKLIRLALDIRTVETSVASRVSRLRPRPDDLNPRNFMTAEQTDKIVPVPVSSYNYQNTTGTFPPGTFPPGVGTNPSGMFPPPPGIFPPSYHCVRQTVKDQQSNAQQEELLLFPFVVLARLFNDFNPTEVGMERAQAIRQQALNLGIIDVLLESLAHFAHQPSRCEQIRPNGHSEPMVQLIKHVLETVSQMDSLWQTLGTMQSSMEMNFGGEGGGTNNTGSTGSTQPIIGTGSALGTAAAETVSNTGTGTVSTAASTVPSSMVSGSSSETGGTTTQSSQVQQNATPLTATNPTIGTGKFNIGMTTLPAGGWMGDTDLQIGTGIMMPSAPINNNNAAASAGTDTFWAKGTGFGSGTIQQQWNMQHHVAKKRQDENNVACLINILISFISPTSSKQQQRAADTDEMEEGSSSSKTGIDLVIPKFASTSTELPMEEELTNSKSDVQIIEEEKSQEKGEHLDTENEEMNEEEEQRIRLTEEFVELMYRSSICQTVNSHLMNDSVLDISKRVSVFKSVISLVLAVAKSPAIQLSDYSKFPVINDAASDEKQNAVDVFDIVLVDDPEKTVASRRQSVADLLSRLKSLGKNIEIYMSKLQIGQSRTIGTTASSSQPLQTKKRHRPVERKAWRRAVNNAQSEDMYEEELGKLLGILNGACSEISKKMQKHAAEEQEHMEFEEQQSCSSAMAGSSSSTLAKESEFAAHLEQIYCQTLKNLQFETIPFYELNGANLTIPFHYASSLTSVGQSGGMNKRTRRLAQEIVSLSSSLPLSGSSSVFVRTSEERLDAMKVLITGPADTPYSNGCFEFDVFFPPDYPNIPMQMNLETTGNRTVRFNPNLYDDGKVCLSILNTWRGRPEERWNADTSSLLQVLVSIQSLIMTQDPYFNEPGYERWRNSPAGQQASREYDANICQMCIRWAMIEQIRNPPKAFAEIVKKHFWLKRDEICEQVEGWIDDIQKFISKTGTSKTLPSYLAGLKKQYESLKDEFTRLSPPQGLEQHHSSRFPNQSAPEAFIPPNAPAGESGSASNNDLSESGW